MANPIDNVADVNPSNETWRLQVRVVRLRNIPSFNSPSLPYAQKMVLLDTHGGKIHSSVRKTLVFKFFNQLKEGEAYEMINFGVGRNVGDYKTTHHELKLNFESKTSVRRLKDSPIPLHGFTFIDMKDLSKNDFDTSYLVDVIGMLSGVGSKKDYEDKDGKPCTFNVIKLHAKGCKVDCALFGSYVQQLNDFLSTSDVSNVVVIIQFARVKNFKGKFVLQNSMYATKMFYNLDVSLALEFKDSFQDYPNMLNELLDGNKEGTALLKKTCEALVTPFLKRAEDTTLPVELIELVGKTFLFKIEVKIPGNHRFEPSYRVKRMTDDVELIEKFKSAAPKIVDVDCTIGSIPESKFISAAAKNNLIDGKNLLADFSLGEADKDSSFGENYDKDYLIEGLELTPSKRLSNEVIVVGEEDGSSCKLKRTIKQEKDH